MTSPTPPSGHPNGNIQVEKMSPLVKNITMKTVAILGASYGGYRAARLLAEGLPRGWRVVVIDRNSHLNHLYVFPRYAVLPGHEYKGFIPYSHIFGNAEESARHLVLNAHITKLEPNFVTLSRSFPEHGISGKEPSLHFDYAVYALGGHMPAPIDLWGPVGDEEEAVTSTVKSTDLSDVKKVQPWGGPSLSEVSTTSTRPHSDASSLLEAGTKAGGIEWLKHSQKRVKKAPSVLVVGGGALGIQYATDIADIYPDKSVTLLHSRQRLLPRFDEGMHTGIMESLSMLNVNTILGDRLDLSSPQKTVRNKDGILEHIVRTASGREIRASLILLCTGQRPNTELMQAMLPDSIVPDGPSKGMIRVKRSLQVGVPSATRLDSLANNMSKLSVDNTEATSIPDEDDGLDVPYPYLFAVGDAADTFGAINAGHTAHAQGQFAVTNILKLIYARENITNDDTLPPVELEQYHPGAPGIKISIARNTMLYQVGGAVGKKAECPDDLQAPFMWKAMTGREISDEDMHL